MTTGIGSTLVTPRAASKGTPKLKWKKSADATPQVPMYWVESPFGADRTGQPREILRISFHSNRAIDPWEIEIAHMRTVRRSGDRESVKEIQVMAESMLQSMSLLIDKMFS